jgi:HK97 gp10 family phage protein
VIEFGSKLSSDLSGLDKYEAAIKQQVLRVGAAGMAVVIYDEARLQAEKHKKTGLLQRAIYRVYSPERSDDASKMYRVSWNRKEAPHGHLIEFGTANAPAYPFLRPAFGKIHEAVANGLARMSEKLNTLRT